MIDSTSREVTATGGLASFDEPLPVPCVMHDTFNSIQTAGQGSRPAPIRPPVHGQKKSQCGCGSNGERGSGEWKGRWRDVPARAVPPDPGAVRGRGVEGAKPCNSLY